MFAKCAKADFIDAIDGLDFRHPDFFISDLDRLCARCPDPTWIPEAILGSASDSVLMNAARHHDAEKMNALLSHIPGHVDIDALHFPGAHLLTALAHNCHPLCSAALVARSHVDLDQVAPKSPLDTVALALSQPLWAQPAVLLALAQKRLEQQGGEVNFEQGVRAISGALSLAEPSQRAEAFKSWVFSLELAAHTPVARKSAGPLRT